MKTIILGGGFTGLAAGITAPNATVYEALNVPGGLGASYEKEGYSFENGGGHWLFGGDPSIIGFIRALTPCKRYERKASVFFPDTGEFFPYPLQSHPDFQKTMELETNGVGQCRTMREALQQQFGGTLCEKFFFPFNESYTAGLCSRIAPQDEYKNPKVSAKGYNPTFLYPTEGLGMLARKMAARCKMRFGKRAVSIDVTDKSVHFSDGSTENYKHLISTLPLNQMMRLTGLQTDGLSPDPFTEVVVLNIGARRGPNCPDEDHWVYMPHSKAGFHRVGFYSNVDRMFLPEDADDRVSVYVEKAWYGGIRFCDTVMWADYQMSVLKELYDWGWITDVDVVDPTFIDCAYTWRWPDSTWREDSIALLKKHEIHQTGRYAEWVFCGIADSIKRGFEAGALYG